MQGAVDANTHYLRDEGRRNKHHHGSSAAVGVKARHDEVALAAPLCLSPASMPERVHEDSWGSKGRWQPLAVSSR